MAGLTPLWGTDGSITTSGFGCHFNAFDCNISQGLTESYGYGDTWVRRHGTILGAVGSISGFTDSGTTANAPGITTVFTRSGISTTLQWKSGCTLAGTFVYSGLSLVNNFLGTPTSSYGFASDGTVTETWVTT